jgi:hypothetical protein
MSESYPLQMQIHPHLFHLVKKKKTKNKKDDLGWGVGSDQRKSVVIITLSNLEAPSQFAYVESQTSTIIALGGGC